MAKLQQLKSRIESIKTSRKITKAMQLVATAKLRKAKTYYQQLASYYITVLKSFSEMAKKIQNLEELIPKCNNDNTLYVIVTSNIGLCGPYNANIIREIKAKMKPNDKTFIFGNKGIIAFQNQHDQVFESHYNLNDQPIYADVNESSKQIIKAYLEGLFKHIKIIYTKFINSVTYEVNTFNLLPIEKNIDFDIPLTDDKLLDRIELHYEFEPSVEKVLSKTIPLYASSILYSLIVESKVSEMSSRRVAMENATENSTQLINDLGIKYNCERQSVITQEITEIVSGAGS